MLGVPEARADLLRRARGSPKGANAAVVGVLLAALHTPVVTQGVTSVRDVAVALVAFALLEPWKVPPWAVVLLSAGAGEWLVG